MVFIKTLVVWDLGCIILMFSKFYYKSSFHMVLVYNWCVLYFSTVYGTSCQKICLSSSGELQTFTSYV